MVAEIIIPSPGESISEVDLVKWFVMDGEMVEKDQEIGEIESEKATLPLIAPAKGIVRLLIQAGTTVAVGTRAASIEPSGPQQASGSDKIATKKNLNPVLKPVVERENEEKKPETPKEKRQPRVSPVAQEMMDQHGLSLEDVQEGLKKINRKEVEDVISLKSQKISDTGENRTVERVRMSALRRKISERLVAVKNETALLTTFNEVDMSGLMQIRQNYQKEFQEKYGIKLGYMSFFSRAVAEALKLYPRVNSMIDGEDLITPAYCDLGIAVQTDKGLMVPVIRNAEKMNIAELETRIHELASKARQNKLSIEEMTGGTFSITNGGVFGSLLSTPILNPPQSGILGMHNIVERPVAVRGQVQIRPMMYIALSYDHRVVDGRDSVGFLLKVKEFVEQPQNLLHPGIDPNRLLLGL